MYKLIIASIILFCFRVHAVSEQNVVRIATHVEPPYIELVDGEYVGMHVNIINLLIKSLNKKIVFIACPFARCILLLQEGKADMIIGIKKTKAREQYLAYLPLPYDTQAFPLHFYLRQDSRTRISKYADLSKLNIGTIRGASYFDPFDNDSKLTKTAVNNYSQLIKMLLKGRIDTFLEREESVLPWVSKNIYENHIKLAKYQYDKSVESYIAISRKSPLFFEWSDISAMQNKLKKSGEIDKLLLAK